MAIQSVGPYIAPAIAAGIGAPTRVSPTSSKEIKGRENPDEPKEADVVATSPSREQLDRAVSEVKKALAPVARNLQFSIDDATGRSVVKVVDATTNEVIRQMPSEELLAITRSLDKLSGLFVKNKA
jgi:flagellar protein FlaG